MTFYNIIFGILFFAALKEVLYAVANDTGHAWEAAIVALLVFGDTVYTSHFVESKTPNRYSMLMKFVDLGNFLILSAALLLLHPGAGNVVDVSIETKLKALLGNPIPEWPFWTLIAGYWILLVAWDSAAQVQLDANENAKAIAKRWPRMPTACAGFIANLMVHGRTITAILFSAVAIWYAAGAPPKLYVAESLFALTLCHQVVAGLVFDAQDAA